MTICGGSYPASQGEHLISHYIDMFAPRARATYLHGEQVAVATLTMARIQEAMLDGAPPRFKAGSITPAELRRRFGAELGDACWNDYAGKHLTADAADEPSVRVAANWDDTYNAPGCDDSSRDDRRRHGGEFASAGRHRRTCEFYRRAVREARFLRDRHTFLDLRRRRSPQRLVRQRGDARSAGSRSCRRKRGGRCWRCCAAKALRDCHARQGVRRPPKPGAAIPTSYKGGA
jgi:glycerol-1-phosphate dehydrogenase [NAD(P)+]